MPTDREIEDFIADSFGSVWDLELLAALIGSRDMPVAADRLTQQMRASALIVEQGIRVLVTAGIALVDEEGRLVFSPVNGHLEACALAAISFYQRFPGRVRRLLIARHNPGLSAFADAFRVRKDQP